MTLQKERKENRQRRTATTRTKSVKSTLPVMKAVRSMEVKPKTYRLRVDKERVVTTVVNMPTIDEDLNELEKGLLGIEKWQKRVLVSEDGLYSAEMIRRWETADMFDNPCQELVYRMLMYYLQTSRIMISASCCLEAFKIVKEAAFYLGGQGRHPLFRRWIDSCQTAFTNKYSGLLVSNETDSIN